MLSFFRRLINSKLGIIVTFVVLATIALAFGLSDVTGLKHGGAPAGDVVATVGDESLSSADLRTHVENEMESFRQQQPTLDMAQFVGGGGLEGTLERMISGAALEKFGRAQGMVVSKRLVDGQLASIPALQGPDGKFSQGVYERLLAQRRITDAQLHADFARDTMAQHLVVPTASVSQVPALLALPYASLLLEKRAGQVGFVPTALMAPGAPPSDADIALFYKRNIARYTVPERRTIRYATIDPAFVKAAATPSDAEVAKLYQAQRGKYAAAEKRTLSQVVIADQAAAAALAAKVKAGTPIADAARAIGLEAATLKSLAHDGYAAQSSADIAAAAFAAARGAVVGPIRSPFGWTVVRIDDVQHDPGKTLEQARPELVAALTKDKTALALGKLHDALDDAISDKATFDELVADHKLTATVSPPLLADGRDPDDAAFKIDPSLAQVRAAAFAAEEGDSPQLVPIAADGSFAVVALGRIIGAAPRPLAQIRPGVARDVAVDRARLAARKVAGLVTERVNKGMPLAQALAATGLKLPPIRPIATSRAQLRASAQGVPPALALLFSMAEHSAKLLEIPQQGGWLIIDLQHIDRGNAAGQPDLVNTARAEIGRVVGQEYVQQFSEAVRRVVGVRKNEATIAEVKASLAGGTGVP